MVNRILQILNINTDSGFFKSNLVIVDRHNKQNLGFTLAMNKFADLTLQEFVRIYLVTVVNTTARPPSKNLHIPKSRTNGDDDIDWRMKGAVTGIKNEGQCGSCWAFSTVTSIEGQWAIVKGELNSLSPQQLIDCSSAYGNYGCSGGLIDTSYQYIIDNKGVDTEDSYPYEAVTSNCRANNDTIGAKISSYKDIQSGSEDDLRDAVLNIGPISGAIDASHSSFQLYSSGVYYEKTCSSTQLDHGVNIVGLGTSTNGQKYYIVKNMWGTDWGMSGYVFMARNKNNNCGIATMNSYPIL